MSPYVMNITAALIALSWVVVSLRLNFQKISDPRKSLLYLIFSSMLLSIVFFIFQQSSTLTTLCFVMMKLTLFCSVFTFYWTKKPARSNFRIVLAVTLITSTMMFLNLKMNW
jgi:hypothetical protein